MYRALYIYIYICIYVRACVRACVCVDIVIGNELCDPSSNLGLGL